MIGAIIFDWGGVLTVGKHSKSIERTLKNEFKAKVNYAKLTGLLDKMDSDETTMAQFTKNANAWFDIDLTTSEMESVFAEAIIPNIGAIQIARQLGEKYPLLMLSNNNKPTVAALRRNYVDMLAIFDKTYFSCELKTRKPDKKIYETVLWDSKLVPKETAFIDDVAPNIETAKKLGMQTIHFKNNAQLKRELQKLGLS